MLTMFVHVLCVFFSVFVGVVQSCNPLACPRLPCSEPVKLRGQCCPYCPCKYDGIYFNLGDLVFTDNPCVTCECSKYGIDCLPFPCTRVDCPNPVVMPGECCPECGCIVGGILYDLGYQVYTRNPCEECRCEFNGEVSCSRKICPPVECSNPIRINGECCRTCGCKGRNGVIHDFGPIDPNEICRPCICNEDGKITCREPECPDVTCPKRNQYIPEGECCPKCRCSFQGDMVYEGPIPTDDKCKPCTCNTNGTVTCEEPDCPEVTCDGKRKYQPEGDCCPKCRCFFKSLMYNPGEDMPINIRDPCVERCHCGADGYEFCDFTVCPRSDCENPVTVPGECCSRCGCLGKKREFVEFGPILDDPCQECECTKSGKVTCGRKQACPKVKCVSGVYKPTAEEPKECCQKCRCKFGGKFYKPGEIFEGPRCQICECRAFTGRVSCEKANCSHVQLQCPNPTYKQGQCCPTCPNGPSCIYKKTVIRYGRYKTVGREVCTCLGDPWFPNAFCAPSTIAKSLEKTFKGIWGQFGYPGYRKAKKKV